MSRKNLTSISTAHQNGLIIECPNQCGLTLPYFEFPTHQAKCSPNLANNAYFIGRTTNVGLNVGHDCRNAFVALTYKISSLHNQMVKLEAVIEQLRERLTLKEKESLEEKQQLLDFVKNWAGKRSSIDKDENDLTMVNDEICNQRDRAKSMEESETICKDNSGENGEKRRRRRRRKKNQKVSAIKDQPDNGIKAENSVTSEETIKTLMTFFSNNNLIEPNSSEVNLIFHYENKAYKIHDVQPNVTFRTLRSLLTDMLGHETGPMLIFRHFMLSYDNPIDLCGFRSDSDNVISLIPNHLIDHEKPGYPRLLTYSPGHVHGSKKETVDSGRSFFSNKLSSQSNRSSADRFMVTFKTDDTSCIVSIGETETTIGEVMDQNRKLIGSDLTSLEMLYLTHLIIEDNFTVNHCVDRKGTTHITVLPVDFEFNSINDQVLDLHFNSITINYETS